MDPIQALESLDDAQRTRVAQWVVLNQSICRSLGIDWEDWVTRYLSQAAQNAGDYSFLRPGGGSTRLQAAGASDYLKKYIAPTAKPGPRFGELMKRWMEHFIAGHPPDPAKVPPSDVRVFQRRWPAEKRLQRLQQSQLRAITVLSDGDDLVLRAGDEEVVRMDRQTVRTSFTDP